MVTCPLCHHDHGVHHNPCENESHIAKLSESVIKSELCDSTICEVESIHFERREKENISVVDDKTCEDIFYNVIISTSGVVSCDMQVAFEEREPCVVQPASLYNALSLEEDSIVPNISEEHAVDRGADLELQPACEINCESIPLPLPPSDLTCTNISAPCKKLQISIMWY